MIHFFKFTLFLLMLCAWGGEAFASDWSVHPVIGIDSAGNATAVWEGTDPLNFNSVIQTNYLPNGSSWVGVTTLTSSSDVSTGPQLAVNGPGDAVAIWRSTDAFDVSTLVGAIYPTGTSWGSPQTISTTETITNDYRVVLNDDGNIVVNWTAYIDDISVIRASVADVTGGTFATPETISP